MIESGQASAARRYKDITGGMTEAVARMRQADAERAAALKGELVRLHEAMERASERETLTVLSVALHWNSALEELWSEHWMKLRPPPRVEPRVSARNLDELDAEVERRYEALRDAVRRRPLLGRR